MVSERSRFDARLNPLAEALRSRRSARRPLLDLTESNPTKAAIPYDEHRIASALANVAQLSYEPAPFGIPSARGAVADLWASRSVAIDPSRVVLTASTSEAYAFLFKLLCDPGDQVLVPSPSYPLFEHLARYESVDVVPYRLSYDGAWHVDVASLREAVTPRSRAVVVVSPNNPTGSYVKRSELAQIAELGLPILSDEVFGPYSLREDSDRARSALEAPGALVFALDGLSKSALLPQMKLAWITVGGPGPLVADALGGLELLCDTYLSPNAAVQHALPLLLESTETSRARLRERLAANLAFVRSRAAGTPATVLDVEGGWYAVLRVPDVKSEEEWTLALLDDRDVLVQPGYFYDFDGGAHLVLSLMTPDAVWRDGIERLVEFVATRA